MLFAAIEKPYCRNKSLAGALIVTSFILLAKWDYQVAVIVGQYHDD